MRCETQEAIAEAVGVPRKTAADWIADYGETEENGDSAIFRDFAPEVLRGLRDNILARAY